MEITTGLHSAQKFALFLRRLACRLARPRHRSTHMKEFLLLLDKDVRKELLDRNNAQANTLLIASVIPLTLVLAPVFYYLMGGWTGKILAGAYLAGSVVESIHLVYRLVPLRREVLLPMYYERLLTKVKTEHEAAICAFNSKLPDYEYRVGAMPRASRDTVDELRVRVAEQRLPTELVPVAQRIGQTQAELAEAELDLADSTATARSETTT